MRQSSKPKAALATLVSALSLALIGYAVYRGNHLNMQTLNDFSDGLAASLSASESKPGKQREPRALDDDEQCIDGLRMRRVPNGWKEVKEACPVR